MEAGLDLRALALRDGGAQQDWDAAECGDAKRQLRRLHIPHRRRLAFARLLALLPLSAAAASTAGLRRAGGRCCRRGSDDVLSRAARRRVAHPARQVLGLHLDAHLKPVVGQEAVQEFGAGV